MAQNGYQTLSVGGTYPAGSYGTPGYEKPVALEPQPHYTDAGQHQQKFTSPGCRDVAFLIVFLIHFLGLGAIIVAGNVMGVDCSNYGGFLFDCGTAQAGLSAGVINLIEIFGVLAACSIVFSVFYIQVLRAIPAVMVWLGIGLNVALFIGSAIWLGVSGQVAGAVITGIFAAFLILYFFLARSRIAFAVDVLRVSAGIVTAYPGTQVVSYFSILVKIAWVLLWSYAVFLSQRLTSTAAYVTAVFLVFSFYWTFEVIKNSVHVTVSGVVASWYFLGDQGPASPTLGALRRALTTSLGSIACGSLIVALIKTLRAIVRAGANSRNRWLTCLCMCFLNCLDRLVQYFNHYAFCQVAIYGHSYWQAAQATWRLMETAGLSALVNDSILDGVLWMGVLLGGLVTGALGYLFSSVWVLFGAFIPPWGAFGLGFAVGVVLTILAMQCLDSAIACTFVCFAEDKTILQQRHPELYQRMMESYFGLNTV